MVYATRPWILKQNRVGREILVYIGYFFPALPRGEGCSFFAPFMRPQTTARNQERVCL